MINQIVLVGHLGQDPESFFSGNGDPVAAFNLAFKSSGKKDDTGWIKVTSFGKLADVVISYLHKGAKIAITGTLHQDKWEDDNGKTKTAFKIFASGIEFIKTDGRGFNDGQESGTTPF